MAATYTEVSLEDMEKYLKRTFRTFKPKKDVYRGETCIDLFLSDNVAVRVMTSVGAHRTQGADVGADAIRILLWGVNLNRPLKTGKAPIVKRTQNWKSNLKDRIEDEVEDYFDKEEYWEGRAGAPKSSPPSVPSRSEPPSHTPSPVPQQPAPVQRPGGGMRNRPPTDKQINFARVLLRRNREPEPNWDEMSMADVSALIDRLKGGGRYAMDESFENDDVQDPIAEDEIYDYHA